MIVRSSETSSCLLNIRGNCFLPVGCRSGHIHPDKEGHGLQGRPGADYWGRSEPTGSRHPSLLDRSGRTHCIPMWDIRLWCPSVTGRFLLRRADRWMMKWHVHVFVWLGYSGGSTWGGWAVWERHCGDQLHLQTAGWQTGPWRWRVGESSSQFSVGVKRGQRLTFNGC